MYPVRIFVSHSFSDIHHETGLESFRGVISETCKKAHQQVAPTLREAITLDIFFDSRSYGTEIDATILSRLRSADIFLVDITGGKENVFYELGFAHASGTALIIIKNRALETEAKQQMLQMIKHSHAKLNLAIGRAFINQYANRAEVPVDLSSLLVGTYSNFLDISGPIEIRLTELLEQIALAVKQGTYHYRPKCFWFNEDIKAIHIVVSQEPEISRGNFASKASDNFISIDSFEDRDSVLELSMYLSRSFPLVEICIHSADELGTNMDKENLVIVGGPLNNRQARQFMKRLRIPINYHLNEDLEIVDFAVSEGNGTRLNILRDAKGLVTRDVGYFGWFQNPLKHNNRIVLCQGYQTWGTLAASRVFGDSTNGRRNRFHLMSRMQRNGICDFSRVSSLQAFFPVEVMEDRRPETPILGTEAPAFWIDMHN